MSCMKIVCKQVYIVRIFPQSSQFIRKRFFLYRTNEWQLIKARQNKSLTYKMYSLFLQVPEEGGRCRHLRLRLKSYSLIDDVCP